MTHAEQILQAVVTMIRRGKTVFTRDEIRREIGISRDEWESGYTAIFQGMRSDHPGGAPKVRGKFRAVFRQVERGKHVLTDYGRQLIQELMEILSVSGGLPWKAGSEMKTATLYSANRPNRTLTLHKGSCSRIPWNQLDKCGCGSTGQLGNQQWWCGEHMTIQAVNEFMNQRLWAALLCHTCFE